MADPMHSCLVLQLRTWGLHTSCLPPTAASACTALPAADSAAPPLGLPAAHGLPGLWAAPAACSPCPGAAAWVPASALAAAPLPVPVVAGPAPMTAAAAAPLPLVCRQQLGPQAGACSCGGVSPFLWCGLYSTGQCISQGPGLQPRWEALHTDGIHKQHHLVASRALYIAAMSEVVPPGGAVHHVTPALKHLPCKPLDWTLHRSTGCRQLPELMQHTAGTQEPSADRSGRLDFKSHAEPHLGLPPLCIEHS